MQCFYYAFMAFHTNKGGAQVSAHTATFEYICIQKHRPRVAAHQAPPPHAAHHAVIHGSAIGSLTRSAPPALPQHNIHHEHRQGSSLLSLARMVGSPPPLPSPPPPPLLLAPLHSTPPHSAPLRSETTRAPAHQPPCSGPPASVLRPTSLGTGDPGRADGHGNKGHHRRRPGPRRRPAVQCCSLPPAPACMHARPTRSLARLVPQGGPTSLLSPPPCPPASPPSPWYPSRRFLPMDMLTSSACLPACLMRSLHIVSSRTHARAHTHNHARTRTLSWPWPWAWPWTRRGGSGPRRACPATPPGRQTRPAGRQRVCQRTVSASSGSTLR